MLKLVQRKEIDVLKWDDLIASSLAETIYPYSWYLDAVSENWSALIVDDYRFVMPVVWKKKAGMKYIYQPFYTQQLGVFSREYVEPELIRQMLKVVYKKFRFACMNFNVKNLVGGDSTFEISDRINYVLPLQRTYEELSGFYKMNTTRNLKRSMDFNTKLVKSVSVEELIRLKQEYDLKKKSAAEYSRMKVIFEAIMEQSKSHIYGIHDEGKLLAAAFMAFSKTRVIYLMSVSSNQGKEQRAMFRIVDELIRSYSNSNYTLDFEGSNIPSVARFFGGFGSRPEVYQNLSFNRLPVPLFLGKRYGK
jgi:hypothetical protein